MFNTSGEVIGIVSQSGRQRGSWLRRHRQHGAAAAARQARLLLRLRRADRVRLDGRTPQPSRGRRLPGQDRGEGLSRGSSGPRSRDRRATIDGQELVLGGDIILIAQDVEILSIEALIQAARAIRDLPPGQQVSMSVLRSGRVIELTTTWLGPEAPPPHR
jgi:hypothetical protein